MKRILRAAVAALAAVASSGRAAAEPNAPNLAAQALEVLRTHCYRCHGQDGANEGGFNYALDRDRLVGRKKIILGDARHSKLFRRLTNADDPMPPDGEHPRPSKADVAVLRRWIDAGAPAAGQPAPERAFVSSDQVARPIQADLDRRNERDRPFTRYFTLVHLANAGISADELQSYRHGLSKLVNSLSWGGRVVVPQAVDPAGTVLRIDLRGFRWNEKTWEAALAANPYGVLANTEAARACAAATRCRLPYVRADWFVAAASRPPLYHDILGVPATERELEALLRVDLAEDIRQERVARAGFNGSGVSRNNRLLERHEAGAVVYWRSYDFGGNTGRQNLFAHPLGPGDREEHFRPDGGEIIFSLPNGLQGYMLVDGGGRRIDKGPTAIVSDPRRPDRAVENGLSCMGCHVRGMIDKADQVRGHVERNRAGFAEGDVGSVRALYPPREEFTALLRTDARRFQEVVARTGAPPTATEPVQALALRFEAELDRPLAAAEAGVRPAELRRVLARSAPLARQLGPLATQGGTVQRQVWVDAFPDVVGELRLGELLQLPSVTAARHVRRGDALARKEDWAAALRAYDDALAADPGNAAAHVGRGEVLLAQHDFARAAAAYDRAIELDPRSGAAFRGRGLAHHRQGDPRRAVADFTAALRLDPRLAVAYVSRAAAQHALGAYDDAIADCTEALRLEPTDAVALNNRGLAYHEKGDYDRAIADFSRALELNPRLAVAFNNRGLAYSYQEDYARAVADYTAAIRLDPRFARAFYNRAVAYEKQGDRTRAAADRERAAQLDPALGKE